MTRPAAFQYDTFETTPEYAGVRDAMRSGAWPRVDAALAALPLDETALAFSSLGELDAFGDVLEAAAVEHPGLPSAGTALVNRELGRAWRARTRAQASDVSEERFDAFFLHLSRAEAILEGVLAAHPGYGPAWAASVMLARGLQLPKDVAWMRYRQHAQLIPHDFATQVQMLQFVLPRWYGSIDETVSFARESAAAAPAGSASGAMLAVLHIESWAELGEEGRIPITTRRVRNELRAAAQRSVLHPAHRQGASTIMAHGAFAIAFWLGNHPADAATHLDAMNARATDWPWRYVVANGGPLPEIVTAIYAAAGEAKGRGLFRRRSS